MVLTRGVLQVSTAAPFVYTANRHWVSPVFVMRADVVHCRTSAGTGPVFLKIVPVTGAAFSCLIMDQSVRLSFPTHPMGGMKWAYRNDGGSSITGAAFQVLPWTNHRTLTFPTPTISM